MHLLTAGDSWTFGGNMRDPNLPDTVNVLESENNAYRIPKIWPTKLAKVLQADDLSNISFPGSSNDRIVRLTLSWITQHYIKPKKDTKDLFVIIGLTSPERKDFYYRDPVENNHGWVTIWPNIPTHTYEKKGMQPFFDNYVMYWWNKEEYTNRYVQQVITLENFFKVHDIKYMFFQGFYNIDSTGIDQWEDKGYINSETEKMNVGNTDLPQGAHFHFGGQNDGWLWEQVSSKNFYGKDTAPHSFYSYITKIDKFENVCTGVHPNEYGHDLWTEELHRFIKENNLI